jgi:hypothetical protein
LANYSESRQSEPAEGSTSQHGGDSESLLFLRVQAAADFFASNKTLMQSPPLVDVDIILDPYLGNVFPSSLVLTAAYIVALAVGSWIASGIIWKRLFSSHTKPHQD